MPHPIHPPIFASIVAQQVWGSEPRLLARDLARTERPVRHRETFSEFVNRGQYGSMFTTDKHDPTL